MIISIYGRIKAGKTTLSDMLVSEYGFVLLSFADALREIVKNYSGVDKSWKKNSAWNMHSDKKYIYGMNRLFSDIGDYYDVKMLFFDSVSKATTKHECYRITLELIGTEVFRNLVSKNIWVAILAFNTVKCLSKGKNIVIDDMRFDEEYSILNKLHSVFIKIESPFMESDNGHESQMYIDSFSYNYFINNDGTEKELLKKFKKLNIVRV